IICHNAENGVDLKGAAEAVIEKNMFYGNTGDNDGEGNWSGGAGGIMHGSGTGSRDVIVRNNIFYDNKGAILVEVGYKVYNNVVIANNRDYTGPNSDYDGGWKFVFSGLQLAHRVLSKTVIKNNIIGSHNHAEICMRRSEVPESMDINNNLYFSGSDFVNLDNVKVGGFENWKTYIASITTIIGNEESSMENDPLFVNVPDYPVGSHYLFNFHLQSGSPCVNTGAFLTKTTNQGSGTQISVEDAGYFCDGWGIAEGDLIQLEGQTQRVRINHVDYNNNIITVDQGLSWSSGQVISLAYEGSAPDIGANEYDDGSGINSPSTSANPDNFTLQQNYPNPFNPSTTIKYSVTKPCNVQIIIYNQLGQEVCALVNEQKTVGEHNVNWNGKDAKGNNLASGIYFYRLTAGKQVDTKRMLYLR
ncbi:MAG: T9SS type A sorting domain-containing protein, partial [Methanosarcinaceae archaeon]